MLAEYILDFGGMPEAAAAGIRIGYTVLLWISALLTVLSGVIYMKDNAKFVDTKK